MKVKQNIIKYNPDHITVDSSLYIPICAPPYDTQVYRVKQDMVYQNEEHFGSNIPTVSFIQREKMWTQYLKENGEYGPTDKGIDDARNDRCNMVVFRTRKEIENAIEFLTDALSKFKELETV